MPTIREILSALLREDIGRTAERGDPESRLALARKNVLSSEFAEALAQRMFGSLLDLLHERPKTREPVAVVDVLKRCRRVVETDVLSQEGLKSLAHAEQEALLQRAEAQAAKLG